MKRSGDVSLRRRQGMPQDAGSLSIGTLSCACQDADGVIQPLFHSRIPGRNTQCGLRRSGRETRATLDPTVRLAWYRKALEILKEDVPGIGLYQMSRLWRAQGICAGGQRHESFFGST